MDSSKQSNKISDIVKLKRMLKKWRIQANNANTISSNDSPKKASFSRSNSMKGINFLKRTLSLNDVSTSSGGVSSNVVPKGFLAVHVGEEMKRFVFPTNYLKAPSILLAVKGGRG